MACTMRVAIEDFTMFRVGEKRSVHAVELRFSDKHMKPAVLVILMKQVYPTFCSES